MLSIPFFIVLASLNAQERSPEGFAPDGQIWELALTAVRVESIPNNAGMGGRDWFGGPIYGWGGDFFSDGDERTVRAQIVHDEEFEHDEVRFHVAADGASVQLFHSSDVLFGPLQDLGGLVCLVTDGEDTALEFESYAVFGAYDLMPFAGVVSLHGLGRELALELSKREAPRDKSPFDRLVRITGKEDGSEFHGYVDSIGRRQGPWSLKQKDGRRLQVAWRDGVPNGTVLVWDEVGRLRNLRHYEFGLESGERIDWNDEDGLWSFDSLQCGQQDGWRVVFDPGGGKKFDREYEAPGPTAYLARFEALHTRPRR